MTDSAGNFVRSFTGSEGVAVTQSGETVASVNEKTGKIELKNSAYGLSVAPASSSEPMTVKISDKSGNPVYWQSFALPVSTKIEKSDKFSDISENGVFVRMESGNDFVRNDSNAASLPGGAFLVNESRKAFAGIGRDGNVYVTESGYSLSYKNEGDYPSVVVKNSFGVPVAEILFRIDAEYVIK